MATIIQIPNTQKGSTTDSSPTTNAQGQREDLPSEAMQFNGEYLEDKIEGYRTLYVRGRESMLAEINAYETGVRDGTGITSKRFPAREIVVGYLLHAKSNEAFREAYNALNGILYTQDAQILFNDEMDKYFTGTPEGLDEIESGRNFVQGEIIIYCADPFKYGLTEITAAAKETITYNGTYKSYPRLEAGFSSDCGYATWFISSAFGNNDKYIQLGDASEEDTGTFYRTETLISQSMADLSGEISSGFLRDADWDQNVYEIYVGVSNSLWGGIGGTIKYSKPYIYPDTFYNARSGKWTGITLSRAIPRAEYDNAYATDWKVTWKQKFCISSGSKGNQQRGAIQVIITDASGNVIAAANMFKGADDTGSSGQIWLHTRNQTSKKTGINMSYTNSYWGSGGSCTMSKSGSKVTFNLGGLSYSLTDSGIESMQARRVTIGYMQRSTYDVMTEGVSEITVTKTNIPYELNIKNTFSNKDTVVADCNSGSIYLNDARNDSLGHIGNDWEGFCLYPGTQTISFSYSDWCTKTPSTKITYREVFI